MTTYPLGRRREGDPRNAVFPMSSVIPTVPLPDYRYWYGYRVHLDQTGDTCVSNSATEILTDSPRTHRLVDLDNARPAWAVGRWTAEYVSEQSAERGFRGWLYDQAQATDPWDDTPPNGGTSVEAAARILRSIGAISSFHWATSIDDIIRTVLTLSPVWVGTSWYQDMFYPEHAPDMLLSISGPNVGGHAWKVDGYNQATEVFRMKNSWGTAWGDNGFAHILKADLDRLIFQDGGDACVVVEP